MTTPAASIHSPVSNRESSRSSGVVQASGGTSQTRAELSRLNHKLSKLPPEAVAQVDHITRLIVEKLLLTPTERLKAVSDDALAARYSDALSRLFSLSEPSPEPDEDPLSEPGGRR